MSIYDQPVWQLIREFADQHPGEFRFAELDAFFRRRYPAVSSSTLRAHLHRMTAGTSEQERLPHLFERVDHGVYRVAGSVVLPERAVSPPDEPRSTATDILLVTCVKTKRTAPAPAKDLYISTLFRKQRRYAEQAGVPWFILSAEYGLVGPDEWLSPYERYLPDCSANYQRAWAQWVVARLELLLGNLRGTVVEIHASGLYASGITPHLRQLGATVLTPLDGLSQGARLAWYADPVRQADNDSESGGFAPIAVRGIVDELSTGSNARRPGELRSERQALSSAGLYSWWVDAAGAVQLSAGLGHTVHPGLIYAGQAGATRWPSGRPSANTLWLRLIGMHLDGSASFSTFRRTLSAVLTDPIGLSHEDDPALTRWIEEHLTVIAVPMADADGLMAFEHQVLEQLDPPLNLSGRPRTPVRRRLSELRRLATTRRGESSSGAADGT